MNQTDENFAGEDIPDDAMTLDPPGRIAVVGAGPLGIEAALYGRFMGYDVTLVDAVGVAASLVDQLDEPLPMLPDRCLSSLANSALDAQAETKHRVLPMTVGQWIDEGLVALTQTDLLAGRLRAPWRVTRIETVPISANDLDDEVDVDESEGDLEGIPPDFRLVGVACSEANDSEQADSLEVEAVIIATGPVSEIETTFDLPADYFFRIGTDSEGTAEQRLVAGRKRIVSIFASLAGRATLDLYQPRRGPA